MATRADLFKYRHSRGRKLDPPSGRLATIVKKEKATIISYIVSNHFNVKLRSAEKVIIIIGIIIMYYTCSNGKLIFSPRIVPVVRFSLQKQSLHTHDNLINFQL